MVQCNSDNSFDVTIGNQEHHVTAELTNDGSRTSIRCNIDGVISSSNIVIQKDALHIFTTVSKGGTKVKFKKSRIRIDTIVL